MTPLSKLNLEYSAAVLTDSVYHAVEVQGAEVMLVHRIGVSLTLVHVLCLSAFPVHVDDKKQRKAESSAFETYSGDGSSSADSNKDSPEPWEVNEEAFNLKGAQGLLSFFECVCAARCMYKTLWFAARRPLL